MDKNSSVVNIYIYIYIYIYSFILGMHTYVLLPYTNWKGRLSFVISSCLSVLLT